jgi:hypothetical protein
MIYVNIPIPTSGMSNEKITVGIPRTVALAGEINAASIFYFSLPNSDKLIST